MTLPDIPAKVAWSVLCAVALGAWVTAVWATRVDTRVSHLETVVKTLVPEMRELTKSTVELARTIEERTRGR